jgi:hypothetical protein
MTVQQNRISELYSDASGTIQFIELKIGPDGAPDWWKGVQITSSHNGITNLYTIDFSLPGWLVPDTTMLLATQAFADRSGVTPDRIIPERFLFSLGGTLQFGNVDAFDYPTLLSADSRSSVARDGTATAPSARTWQGITAPLPEPLPLTDTTNDAIKAWNAQQSAEPRTGDHTINADLGFDLWTYPLARSAYTLHSTSTPGQYQLEKPGAAGTDILNDIDRLQFTDTFVALDVAGYHNHAGQVAKLLGAVFGPEAVHNKVYAGMGLKALDGRGGALVSYETLASSALDATGKSSPADVVSLLWTNLVGSAPTAAEAAPYIAMLDHGMKAGALVVMAAEHPLNAANIDLAGLAQTGLEYTPYTG